MVGFVQQPKCFVYFKLSTPSSIILFFLFFFLYQRFCSLFPLDLPLDILSLFFILGKNMLVYPFVSFKFASLLNLLNTLFYKIW